MTGTQPDDPTPCAIRLGAIGGGDAYTFVPLHDGDSVPIITGGQAGGHHIWYSVLAHGFDPSRPISVECKLTYADSGVVYRDNLVCLGLSDLPIQASWYAYLGQRCFLPDFHSPSADLMGGRQLRMDVTVTTVTSCDRETAAPLPPFGCSASAGVTLHAMPDD